MWSAFSSEVHHIMTDLIHSKWSTSRYNQLWVTTAIKRLARRKKRAHRKFRASGNNRHKTRFDRLKQEMQRVTRQAFNDYVMDILDPASDTNAKRLYSYVKSQKKDSSSVGPLRGRDGQRYSSPGRKANILNDQFASVFTVEDEY